MRFRYLLIYKASREIDGMGSSQQMKSKRVLIGEGIPCHKCRQLTQWYRHADDWVSPKKKGWYDQWFACENDDCPVRQIYNKQCTFHQFKTANACNGTTPNTCNGTTPETSLPTTDDTFPPWVPLEEREK
jgi:hypothetical protein